MVRRAFRSTALTVKSAGTPRARFRGNRRSNSGTDRAIQASTIEAASRLTASRAANGGGITKAETAASAINQAASGVGLNAAPAPKRWRL